ncbi:hypothetical protein F751_3596 [Auxenochlorella protothecoides]|uniref:Uncharacterized protein n=1 Tax=Auxenochlorella protothecoides TaxID=3075 RepID=A0A087SJQ4_AUXPR|nr:hypothetical protein F751_3596 [Auxenochlorella protothecoides]KFM25958.1 hypothetical protein F751_3596 [Auxenochlorella protothecoides]
MESLSREDVERYVQGQAMQERSRNGAWRGAAMQSLTPSMQAHVLRSDSRGCGAGAQGEPQGRPGLDQVGRCPARAGALPPGLRRLLHDRGGDREVSKGPGPRRRAARRPVVPGERLHQPGLPLARCGGGQRLLRPGQRIVPQGRGRAARQRVLQTGPGDDRQGTRALPGAPATAGGRGAQHGGRERQHICRARDRAEAGRRHQRLLVRRRRLGDPGRPRVRHRHALSRPHGPAPRPGALGGHPSPAHRRATWV